MAQGNSKKPNGASRTPNPTTPGSSNVSNMDTDTPMGIDPAKPGEANGQDEDEEMDEAADLEMMDAMYKAGEFDTDEEEEDEEGDDANGIEIDGEDQELEDDDIDEDEAEEEDEDDDDPAVEGVPLPADAELPLIGAPSSSKTPSAAPAAPVAPATQADLHPERPTPYTLDLGHLLVSDPNTLPPDSQLTEAHLLSTTRDATQTLLNALLTQCPIRTLPPAAAAGSSTAGVTITLPDPVTQLPREKKVPTKKEDTPWERFAKKKGVGKYNPMHKKGQEGENRAGKMVYDEAKGDWVPKWGYKGKNKDAENSWLVEVDEKKGQEGGDPRSMKRAERKERVKRNERLARANDRKARGAAGGGGGV